MGRPRKEEPPLRQRGDFWYATVYVNGRPVERSTGERDETEAARVAGSWTAHARQAEASRHEASARPGGTRPRVTLNDVLSELLDDTRAKIRSGNRSADTLDFYEKKAGSLLAFFGHDFDASAWSKDSKASWDYIRWRRSSKVTDASIRKELGTLRTALYLAQEQGLFSGNPTLAIPPSFTPETKPAERSPTREEFLALVPLLHPDAAAATAFILATSCEWSALKRAQRSDLPAKMKLPFTVHVRGSKTDDRDRRVPIVTDEQAALLAFAAEHAGGEGEALFSSLANYNRTLAEACHAAGIEGASANDFRHAAGQWLIDLGAPIELVSRFMGHADTRITERVYARVKQEHVGDRMLEALDPRYTRSARKRKAGPRVKVVTKIPAPKLPTLYEVDGVERTLSGWAQATGIKKNTLHSRLAAGATMREAIRKSLPSFDAAGKLPGNSGSPRPLLEHQRPDVEQADVTTRGKKRSILVRRDGIEPPTRGFSVPCSTD